MEAFFHEMKRNGKKIRLDLSYEVFWITKRRLELREHVVESNWIELKWETFQIMYYVLYVCV